MRGLKPYFAMGDQLVARVSRAIRPAYEGIETSRITRWLTTDFSVGRAIRPAYEGIETHITSR